MLGALLTLFGLANEGKNALCNKAYDIKSASESTTGEYFDHKGVLRSAYTNKRIYRCCGDDGHYYVREGDWYDHAGEKIGTIDETLRDRIIQLVNWRSRYWNDPEGSKGVLMHDAKYIYYQMKKLGCYVDYSQIHSIFDVCNKYRIPDVYVCYKNHREGNSKLCYKTRLQRDGLKLMETIIKEKYGIEKVFIAQEFYIDIFNMNIYAAEGKYANEFRGKSSQESNRISWWVGEEYREVTIFEMEELINEFNRRIATGIIPEWKRTGIEKLFVEGTIELKRLCGRRFNERSGRYE